MADPDLESLKQEVDFNTPLRDQLSIEQSSYEDASESEFEEEDNFKITPEILEKKVSLQYIIESKKSKDKINKKEQNILEEETQKTLNINHKGSILETNYTIIGVGEQFLTKEALNGINDLSKEAIDPEGRHCNNALDLMMSDGILNILPKKDDSWVDFVRPFLRLTRIEKDFYKNKRHE